MSKQNKEDSQVQPKSKWEDLNYKEKDKETPGAEDIHVNEEKASPEKEQADEPVEFLTKEALEQQLAQLKRQLTEKEQKINEYKDKVIRLQAEMENQQKRSLQSEKRAFERGTEKIVEDLSPIIDGLMRAQEEMKDNQGIRLILNDFFKLLSRHEIEFIDPKKGDSFDPGRHEALSMQKDPQAKPHSILQVVQNGYEYRGRVLRAALVIVAAE